MEKRKKIEESNNQNPEKLLLEQEKRLEENIKPLIEILKKEEVKSNKIFEIAKGDEKYSYEQEKSFFKFFEIKYAISVLEKLLGE